jgi:murein L,D-transpeptidase YafK
MNFYFLKRILLMIGMALASISAYSVEITSNSKVDRIIREVTPGLKKELQAKNLTYGNPIFIRIFKSTSILEVWVQKQEKFELFKIYYICAYSGGLGPKTKRGDHQAPEGFYAVRPDSLNPWSKYHLSFNLGYPNEYDRQQGYTGDALMVHGKCVSIGCYAMGDKYIAEIYTLAVAAFKSGQPFFRVHVFPFVLDDETLGEFKDHKWYSFWKGLQPGYAYFNQHKIPPNIIVKNKRYYIQH